MMIARSSGIPTRPAGGRVNTPAATSMSRSQTAPLKKTAIFRNRVGQPHLLTFNTPVAHMAPTNCPDMDSALYTNSNRETNSEAKAQVRRVDIR